MITKDSLRSQFSKEWEKHYKVKVLEDLGFRRAKCKKCGRNFWSTVERDICADSCCQGYEFIGNPPSRKKLGYAETWKEIEEYFTKHGHGNIKPYPTVARWRDDLYFTVASINDFQPYVVSGEMEAPANPLIVPQPCIRFPDISNVGVSGRHFTNFVMVGQHAFNTEQSGTFYWKNEALEHDVNYVQKLGLPIEEIVFIEDVWMGGGNFGPSMEYFARGLELGNCVFMQYEIIEGKSRELKTKVIDMGAGLSRLCWITHGAPDSYQVVYGDMVPAYMKKFGVKVDDKLYLEFARRTGKLDVEDIPDPTKEIARIEKEIGHPGFGKTLAPLHGLYATLDHLLTLLFTVKDGMLPSNAGGGYNLRMITRRVFGLEEEFGWSIDYGKLLSDHAKRLHNLFPELKEGVATTSDVIHEEKKKYQATKEKAGGKVASLLKKKKGGEEELLLLYQSHGIPPEFVAEEGKKQGLEIDVPLNFYEKARSKEEGKEEEKKQEGPDVRGLPNTEPLYYSTQGDFTAKVLAVLGNYVVLDRSAFYPESGGQAGDRGELNSVPVLDTKKAAGAILHLVDDPEEFKKGVDVEGKVDMERRRKVTRHHTSAHLLNAACKRVLGNHIWQGGSGKEEDKAHLDVTHYKRITDEELDEIERKVNEYIRMDIPIESSVMPRNEAEKKYGFALYQGGAVPGRELRIVKVGDIDAEACGGTHQMLKRTGEIGCFKIVKRESVQDGIERITYKAGDAAIEYMQERESLLKESAGVFKVAEHQLPQTSERFFREWKEQRKEIEKLKEYFAKGKAEELAEKSKKEGVVEEKVEEDQKTLMKIGGLIAGHKGAMAILYSSKGDFVCAAGKGAKEDARKLMKRLKGAKGGGSESLASGRLGKL